MNVKLRKRHKGIWAGFGFLMATMIIRAVGAIPANPISNIPVNACPAGIESCFLPEHTDFVSEDNLRIRFSGEDLRLNLRSPLKSSFTLVYLSPDIMKVDEALLLGQMSEMGDYNFQNVKSEIENRPYLILYDQLKKKNVFHIKIGFIKR